MGVTFHNNFKCEYRSHCLTTATPLRNSGQDVEWPPHTPLKIGMLQLSIQKLSGLTYYKPLQLFFMASSMIFFELIFFSLLRTSRARCTTKRNWFSSRVPNGLLTVQLTDLIVKKKYFWLCSEYNC